MLRKIIGIVLFWIVALVPWALGKMMDADYLAIIVAALAYGYLVMPGLMEPIKKWVNRDDR